MRIPGVCLGLPLSLLLLRLLLLSNGCEKAPFEVPATENPPAAGGYLLTNRSPKSYSYCRYLVPLIRLGSSPPNRSCVLCGGGISDAELWQAVMEIATRIWAAGSSNSGWQHGEGTSGGARAIVAMKVGLRVVLMFGFEKKDIANIKGDELERFAKQPASTSAIAKRK